VRAIAERGAVALDNFVSTAMTREVVTCRETETITSIMDRMTSGKFRHLPVVDQDRPVGMISISDVIKYRVHEMKRDAAQMREYILTT
jgi:CBS domain-containing protein